MEQKTKDEFITTALRAGVPKNQLVRFLGAKYIPLPWQMNFHAACREADLPGKAVDIGAGGARGPGKSHGVFAQVTLDDCQRTKGLKALFLRQTGKAASESFEDLIRRVIAHKIKYKYNRSTNVLAFPNGSRVILGGFETDKDIDKYIGIEYDLIAIEERNQLTNDKIIKLKGSLRTSRDDWRPRMYSSFNPGGVGHGDLKNHFIIPNREGTEKKTKFIPATYRDNPYLNIEYVDYLESLTGDLGRMWRDGDWDIFAGQFFSEWRQDKHVIEPFAIPPTWKRVRSIDVSGRAGITSCHWYAIDYDGNVYAYREHYKTGLDSDQHAREIAKMGHSSDCPALTVLNKVGTEMGEVEKKEVENSLRGLSQYCMGKTCEKYPYTVIDASAFAKIGTPETIAELYIRNGVTDLVPSSKQRVMGWDFMHQYLRWEEVDDPVAGKITIGPKLKFFNTCTEAIRSIPTLIHDDKNPEDLDTRGDDHVADEARYFLQTLRESASPKPMSFVERRLMEMNSTNF